MVVGVHFEALDDVEDDFVCLVAFEGYLLKFKEGVDFVVEIDFVTFRLGVVLWEEETVDGVLCPVLGEVGDGFVVSFLCEVGDDALDECFCILGLFYFGGDESVFDDDLAIDEVFGEDEDTGVGAKGDFTGVAVAEKDFGFAGVFARASGEGECYCCHIFLILFYGKFTQNGGQKQLILSPKFISDENG